jgi:hypothetical protein
MLDSDTAVTNAVRMGDVIMEAAEASLAVGKLEAEEVHRTGINFQLYTRQPRFIRSPVSAIELAHCPETGAGMGTLATCQTNITKNIL